jgi:hypothetical protein
MKSYGAMAANMEVNFKIVFAVSVA